MLRYRRPSRSRYDRTYCASRAIWPSSDGGTQNARVMERGPNPKAPLSWPAAAALHRPAAWLQFSCIAAFPSRLNVIVYTAELSGFTTPMRSSEDRNSTSRHVVPANPTGPMGPVEQEAATKAKTSVQGFIVPSNCGVDATNSLGTRGYSGREVTTMTNSTKLVRLALPVAVVAIGIAAAVMLGGGGMKHSVMIPSGTELIGALEQSITTDRSSVGDHITLRTVDPIQIGNDTIPEGVTVLGEVTHVKGGGRIAGAPELSLRFTQLELDGTTYQISAESFSVSGKNDAKESALAIGGGAVVGGVLNGAKGAIVGAAIGTGVAVATEGDQLTLGAGQHLRIRLTEPLTVKF